jgi:hypothetical protein
VAALLQTDPAVQYADPVRRVYPALVPNDPLYPQQWALSDAVGGVNARMAWSLQTGNSANAVAVVDTGVTVHPEFANRFLPGYDFISDSNRANDGNGRDNDGSDPGDATSDGECGPGIPGEPSSWPGTFVSGLIAANTDNGVGIAGMDWAAKVLPVRVLASAAALSDDVAAGVLWAAGLPVADCADQPILTRHQHEPRRHNPLSASTAGCDRHRARPRCGGGCRRREPSAGRDKLGPRELQRCHHCWRVDAPG